jgi:sulfur-carrier protein
MPNKQPVPEVLVILPRPLLALFPDATAEVKIPAQTVGEMIAALDSRWPGMGHRLCDETPRIRQHLSIFCNGRRTELASPLKPGDEVYVLTAVSGG